MRRYTFILLFLIFFASGTYADPPIDNRIVDHFRWDELCESEGEAEKTNIWECEAPLYINNFCIGMSAENLQALLKDNSKEVDEGIFVYAKNAVIRIESGRVVNIAVSVSLDLENIEEDTLWELKQNNKVILVVGSTVDECEEALGKPICAYNKEDLLRIVVYNHKTSDLGVVLMGKYVVGFMLTDPGILIEALRWSGYTLEEK